MSKQSWFQHITNIGVVTALLCSQAGSQSLYPLGTTVHDPMRAYQGNTLYAAADGEVKLIDMAGNLVNSWTSPTGVGAPVLPRALGPDRLLINVNTPDPVIGVTSKQIFEVDGDGNIMWDYTIPSWVHSIHHDTVRLPNGNTLLLGSLHITIPYISAVELVDDCIIEVDPAGQLVWAWFTFLHFFELGLDLEAIQLIKAQGGDWAHANAISPLPANSLGAPFDEGDILISYRFTNTVALIDKATGAIDWLSGPNNALTHGQHNPNMIAPGFAGAGNILVFDNGSGTGYPLQGRAPGYSSVKEINPTTNEIEWQYDATLSGNRIRMFWSDIISGAQRLPNGNTLITSGVRGRLFEVNSDGAIVWEYMTPYWSNGHRGNPNVQSHSIYRSERIPSNYLLPSPSKAKLPRTTESAGPR